MSIKIVYLDDEIDLCDNFSDCFASAEVLIETFTDPNRAIAAVKANPPDILFVDYRLPMTTGDKVAQQLDPAIPKFLITGDLSVESEYKFLQIISKPYKESEIASIIQKYQNSAA